MTSTGIDPKYFLAFQQQYSFVDPTTGEPLALGYVKAYKDKQRNDPKPLYQISGDPPSYIYETVPNPLPLSATGNPMNGNDQTVDVYYYPFDEEGNLELYYLEVYREDGTVAYEIPAMPNLTEADHPSFSTNVYENQISNSQFVEVSFQPDLGFVLDINSTITEQEYQIAPNWVLLVSTNGAANITINQTGLEGALNIPTNPPFACEIQSSGAVTILQLIQRLENNPDIWASTTLATGFLAGYFLTSSLDGLPHTVSLYYSPSVAPSPLVVATGSTGVSGYREISGTVEVPAGVSSDTGFNGYIDMILELPVNGHYNITSVQAVGMPVFVENILYSQETANRQRDHLFNYYEEPLKYKPIPSYLIGWDFPLNPAQYVETGTMGAIGANTSKYIWDRTICYQSTTNSISYSRTSIGCLGIAPSATTQFALIQYLTIPEITEIFNNPLSSNVNMDASAEDIKGTISLWYTEDVTLPDIKTSLSLVSSLDANGKPDSFNGTWVEIPRNSVDATFSVEALSGTFVDYGFSGWQVDDFAEVAEVANYFAIVVGFSETGSGDSYAFGSVSLAPGSISTRPAPQTCSQVLQECQYYYRKSYPVSSSPGTPGDFEGALYATQTIDIDSDSEGYRKSFSYAYPSPMRVAPDLNIYSPLDGAGGVSVTYYIQLGGVAPAPTSGSNPKTLTGYSLANNDAEGFIVQSNDTGSVMQITSSNPALDSHIFYQFLANSELGWQL